MGQASQPIDFRQHICSDVHILRGKPCIKGTRVPVYIILDALGAGATYEEIMEDYGITEDDIRACLAFAARLADEEIIPLEDLIQTP